MTIHFSSFPVFRWSQAIVFLNTCHMSIPSQLWQSSTFPVFHFSIFPNIQAAPNCTPTHPPPEYAAPRVVCCRGVWGMRTVARIFAPQVLCRPSIGKMKRSTSQIPPPGVSFDGRSSSSRFWGPSGGKLVKMCPHVKPGGGVCGLEPQHCFCTCLLCGSLMHGRKACNARMPDGTRCTWGADRSPDVSSPEQEPAPPPRKRRAVQVAPSAYVESSKPPSPLFDQRIGGGLCLPNLEPGGPGGLPTPPPRRARVQVSPPEQTLDITPVSSPQRSDISAPHATPVPRPATQWHRTLFAQDKIASPASSSHSSDRK